MNDANDVEIRRARLRVLRERYDQSPATSGMGSLAGSKPTRDAEPARLPVPVQPRTAGAKARGAQRAAGGLLQRVAAFLTQEGPGAKFISGTPIREDRLGQLVQFLKRRGAAASGQQAQRARGILAYLTETDPGERMIAGVNIARAALLLERANDQQPRTGEKTVDFAEGAEVIEGNVLAVEPDTATNPIGDDNLSELVERAQRLSQELLTVQRKIARRIASQAEVAKPVAATRPDTTARSAAPKPSPKPNGEWFMDFLD